MYEVKKYERNRLREDGSDDADDSRKRVKRENILGALGAHSIPRLFK